ncbi:DNA-processing protein DprA [Leifsonia sp. NCR5]|uniref:DNA-processing protein DprA n=1 Tax=Leifsonia sp. NCR5 TaxID=1978342 RepID=UPI000A18BCCE|nr:DNA-processing protein DprA [Leifsonia sp. NCR5]
MTPTDFLGIPHADLADLLRPVTPTASVLTDTTPASSERPPDSGDRAQADSRSREPRLTEDGVHALETRFAWAAISTLIEPGDTDARLLADTLGPREALRSIVVGDPADIVLGRLREVDELAADTLSRRLTAALERWKPRIALATATRALTSAAHLHATLLTPADDHWPSALDALGHGAPLTLWVRGDLARLRQLDRSIALVGARASTGYGEHVAMESAAALSDNCFAIVSGGAYGIDGAAHRATLASNQTTVAFLAGGVDRLYPAGNTRLLQRIAERGLLIGELPCGSPPTRWRFLQRNRLIAAVATATIVIEAGSRSGSLNTAGHAAMMGRPLGAVPGPITSPASSGCHRLIREYDAVCVTTPDEMAELAGDPFPPDSAGVGAPVGCNRPMTHDRAPSNEREGPTIELLEPDPHPSPHPDVAANQPPAFAESPQVDGHDVRLRDALSARTPRSIPDIAARAGLSPSEVMATLGRLELAGQVTEDGGGWRTTR